MRIMRMFCAALLLLAAAIGTAQPRQIGGIYEVDALCVVQDASTGALAEQPVKATLHVLATPNDPELADTRMEVQLPPNARLIILDAADLPEESARQFPGRQRLMFPAQATTMRPGTTTPLMSLSFKEAAKPPQHPMPGGDVKMPSSMRILDARGRPASGFEVRIEGTLQGSRYTFFKGRPAADGSVPVELPIVGQPMYSIAPMLFVHNPATGEEQFFRLPVYDMQARQIAEEIHLAMIPELLPPEQDPPADVFGVIVEGADGAPMRASVAVRSLRTAGVGGSGNEPNPPAIRTGDSGRVQLVLSAAHLKSTTGQATLPAASQLTVYVYEGTDDFALPETVSVTATLDPGKWTTVRLARGERLRMQFLDDTGEVIDFGDLRYSHIGLVRHQEGREMQQHTAIRWEDGKTVVTEAIALPATLQPIVQDRRFKAQEIQPGASNAVITWELEESRLSLVGRVLDIRDGSPIAGAYVALVNEATGPWKLASMSAEDRARIYESIPADGRSRPGPGAVRRRPDRADRDIPLAGGPPWYAVILLARTDAEGFYALYLPSGQQVGTVAVWAPGMLAMQAPMHLLLEGGTHEGVVELPDAHAVPAAIARVTVTPPDKVPDRFRPEILTDGTQAAPGLLTIVTFEPESSWRGAAPLLNPTREQPWKLIHAIDWTIASAGTDIHVPAAVPFSLTMHGDPGGVIGRVNWQRVGPFAQGSTHELPAQQIPARRAVRLRVRHADGTPAKGLGVRLDGWLPVILGEDGTAIAWPFHDSIGRLSVHADAGWQPLLEKNDIDIPQTEDGSIAEIELILEQ